MIQNIKLYDNADNDSGINGRKSEMKNIKQQKIPREIPKYLPKVNFKKIYVPTCMTAGERARRMDYLIINPIYTLSVLSWLLIFLFLSMSENGMN